MTEQQRFDQYRCEMDAVRDIVRLWNEDQGQRACNRLAEHVRQQAHISANAEHGIMLIEQAFKRGRGHDNEIRETIARIKSWCELNHVPADVSALPNQ